MLILTCVLVLKFHFVVLSDKIKTNKGFVTNVENQSPMYIKRK